MIQRPREFRDAASEVCMIRAKKFADAWLRKTRSSKRFKETMTAARTAAPVYESNIEILRNCWLRVRYARLMIQSLRLRRPVPNLDSKIDELRVFKALFSRYNAQRARFERYY